MQQLSLVEPHDDHATGETATDQAPAQAMGLGQQYQACWLEYGRLLREQNAARQALRQKYGDCGSLISVSTEEGINQSLCETANEILISMVRHAEDNFAPPGVNLSIPRSHIEQKFSVRTYEGEGLQKVDLAGAWKYLEDNYGGQAGRDEAWRQAARGLQSEFGLHRKDKVVEKGGYVVLEDRVWIDGFDKKYDGKNNLSYSSQQSIIECCKHLEAFARWADRTMLMFDIKGFAHKMWMDRDMRTIESRKKFTWGGGEIVLVTYTNKFEYRIRKDLAAQLQVFLGSYGSVHHE